MNNQRVVGQICFFLVFILFNIGEVRAATEICEASTVTAQVISMPSLGLVLVAVAIIVAMIFIYRLPENRYKNIAVLTDSDKQEIASLKNTIEKIRTLEEEKWSLLVEIEELKKLSEARATALENEVNALRNKVKIADFLRLGLNKMKTGSKKCKNKTFKV